VYSSKMKRVEEGVRVDGVDANGLVKFTEYSQGSFGHQLNTFLVGIK